MAKDKDKIELKPESKKSDKKSEAESSGKKDEKQSSKTKKNHVAATPVFIALAVLIVGVCAFMAYSYINNRDSEDATVAEEVELTPAEEQEQYHLVSTAPQDAKNSVALSNAWAYYREDNYSRALELLDSMIDPNDVVRSPQEELYGLIYEAQGELDKAREYFVLNLNEYEDQLLEDIKTYPEAHYTLAGLYYKAGENDKAIEHYEAYIEFIDARGGGTEEFEDAMLQNANQALEELK